MDVLAEMDVAADVEHVEDLRLLASLGAFTAPGLAIDGRVVSQGKLPSRNELKRLLGQGE